MDLEPASYLCCGLLTFECLKGYLSLKGGAVLLATLLLLLLLRAYFVILGAGTDLSYLSEILGPSQLVSFGIIALLNQMIGTFDDAFSFSFHLEAHSVIVAFCLGMIITFATAAVSAYRVSRMNITEAVRGLPETIVLKGEEPFFRRFLLIPKALVQPLIYLWQALRDLANTRFSRFWLALGGAVLWLPLLPIWWVGLSIAVVRFLWPYLRRGWLAVLLGVLLVYLGAVPADQVAPFAIGSSLIILGIGLMLRLFVLRLPRFSIIFGVAVLASGLVLVSHGVVKGDVVTVLIGVVVATAGVSMTVPIGLGWTDRREEVINRLAFTFIGVILLAYWMLPFNTMEPITGVLEDDIEMFFISGIMMVTAAVWTVDVQRRLVTPWHHVCHLPIREAPSSARYCCSLPDEYQVPDRSDTGYVRPGRFHHDGHVPS